MMRQHIYRWTGRGLLGLAAATAMAQPNGFEPRPLRLQLIETYVAIDFEFDHQVQTAGSPAISVTRDRILLQPVLGFGLAGSVYHPNLLDYRFNTELGLNWQDSSVKPGREATDAQFLQRYHATVTLLRLKPVATILYADKDLTYRDYDFYTRVRVDSERYGARTGYTAGPVPFTVSASHYDERETSLLRPFHRTEDMLNFNAHNSHRADRGRTDLTYNLQRFSWREDSSKPTHGLAQNLGLSNTETFGRRDWIRLNSLLNYNSMTEVVQPTDKLMLQQNLRLQHSPQLESTGDFVFDTASAGATDSTTYQGRLGLTHRLYQNLTSAIDLHGDTTTGRGGGSTLTTSRAGVGLSEQYTKRFSPDLNVALGYGARFDHEDRHASGALLNVVNESHTLTDGVLTFLGQPLITGPITVTDPNENPYTEGLDYQLIPHGQLTEIRRLNGGRIANGGLVYVDYTANLQPSATFWAIGHTGTFRLDFFRNHFGLYGRWLSLDYTGAKQLLLRTEDDKVIGLDTTWEWFRASAEYENMDSNLAPYDRVRLVQSFQFQPADEALLGVDFDENWATFRDTNIHDSSYSLITRYQQRFSPHLLWNAEGGLRLERGSNATFDHTTGTARTSLDWTIAKLTLKLGYEYNSDSHRTDRYQRHYCFLRARRRF